MLVTAGVGCGGQNGSGFLDAGGGASGSPSVESGTGTTGSTGTVSGGSLNSGNQSGGTISTGTFIRDAAVSAEPSCPDGGQTTISGTVYDPSMQDPLYNVTVFIPLASAPLPTLSAGASCAACADFYPANIVASAGTDTKGHFTISQAPTGPAIPFGQNIPIVVQTGKWRMQYVLPNVTACQDNPQPDKSLHLPRSASEGNLPDIAISTGGADSLECLPLRIGVDASEYGPGAAGPGHE